MIKLKISKTKDQDKKRIEISWCFWNLTKVKLNWFLESKFNWLTWIIKSLRAEINKGSLKPNFTLNTKTTLIHLNKAVRFGYVLVTNNVVSVNAKSKIKVRRHIVWLLFIIFPIEPKNGNSDATFQPPPPPSLPPSLSYLHHTRKKNTPLSWPDNVLHLQLENRRFVIQKINGKWPESPNPVSLTMWFCRTRLLVCGQRNGSFLGESMTTNYAHETPHAILSPLINRGEFHARGKEKRGNKKGPCTNPKKPKATIFRQPFFHIKPLKNWNQTTSTIPYNNPLFTLS